MAHTFINLSFEDAGATPGLPDGWTGSAVVTPDEIAPYGPVPSKPWEDYEAGWSSNEDSHFVFVPADLEAAIYNGVSYEAFFPGWGNEGYVLALTVVEAEVFYKGPDVVPPGPWPATVQPETFGNYWLTSPPAAHWIGQDWSGGDTYSSFTPDMLEAAVYVGAISYEGFESGWNGNEGQHTTFVEPGDLEAAVYGAHGGSHAVEDFESVYLERSFHVDESSDLLKTDINHDLLVGDRVFVRNEGGQLPYPLDVSLIYYVVLATVPTEIKVSLVAGGAAVDLVDLGNGTHYLMGDPDVYWRDALDI